MSVEICSNISDAGDLLEGQFVAIAGENDMGDVVVWYASVKGGEGLFLVLVRQILVEYDVYTACASVGISKRARKTSIHDCMPRRCRVHERL